MWLYNRRSLSEEGDTVVVLGYVKIRCCEFSHDKPSETETNQIYRSYWSLVWENTQNIQELVQNARQPTTDDGKESKLHSHRFLDESLF